MQQAQTNTLGELVTTLEQQRTVREDLIVPSDKLKYENGNLYTMAGGQLYDYKMSDLAHDQMGSKLEIPRAYYSKMQVEYPELLEKNVNMWLSKKEKTKFMLRTFNYGAEGIDNICRAILSNRYNIMDNYDVLICALEAVKKSGINVKIEKATVTDKRMYLHIIAPEIQIEAEELLQDYMKYRRTTDVGNGIISGLVLSNSELGCGSFECSARAVIMRCTNGLTDRNAAIRRVHLGSKLEEGIIEWSDDTKNKNFQLIMSQTQDAIKTFLSKDYLGNLVKKLEGHKKTLLEHPEGVIEKVGQVMNISESHKINVLRHFLQDNDNSCFGMMNAFIREAQNMQADMQFTTEQTAFSMMGQYKSFDKPSKN